MKISVGDKPHESPSHNDAHVATGGDCDLGIRRFWKGEGWLEEESFGDAFEHFSSALPPGLYRIVPMRNHTFKEKFFRWSLITVVVVVFVVWPRFEEVFIYDGAGEIQGNVVECFCDPVHECGSDG